MIDFPLLLIYLSIRPNKKAAGLYRLRLLLYRLIRQRTTGGPPI